MGLKGCIKHSIGAIKCWCNGVKHRGGGIHRKKSTYNKWFKDTVRKKCVYPS